MNFLQSSIRLLLSITLISILFKNTKARQQIRKSRLREIFERPKTPFTYSTSQAESKPEPEYNFKDYFVEKGEQLLSKHKYKAALLQFRIAAILGQHGALVTAAVLKLSGDNTRRDLASAVRHLRLAENHGQPNAQSLIGYLHASGMVERHGISKSPRKSLLYWTFAAEALNPYASSALGFRYLYGIDVEKSCLTAAKYYRRSAKAIVTDARYWPSAVNFVESKPPLPSGLVEAPPTRLEDNNVQGNNADNNEQDVVHYYRAQADHGHTFARTTLGALYYFGGHGIEPDEDQARDHLRIAARAGNGQAHTILGHMDMRARKNQSAFEHFMHGAGESAYNSHYALGMVYNFGLLGKEIDYSKAKMHFELSVDLKKDHANANFQLGIIYWYGRGTQRDSKTAFDYFGKAANAGNVQSKWNVGVMMTNRAERTENLKEKERKCNAGVKYLKEVAEEGEWKTVLEMASEKVDKKDWYGALYRYLQAAHAGIELAQYNAAYLLETLKPGNLKELRHWDRRRMLKEARELYTFSALQGHTDSLIRCAKVVYVEMKDYAQAAAIFREASDLGSAEGMVSLGLMYARGLGVAQNRTEAVSFIQSARYLDSEAVASANVGLIAIRLYWICEDLWRKVTNMSSYMTSWRKNEHGEVKRDVEGRELLKLKVGGDVAVIGILIVALVAVLIVRTKRLARQHGTSSSTESESDSHRTRQE